MISYRLFFEILHVEVGNDSGNRTPHGGAVFLLVNRSVILEVCGSQYKGQRSAICTGLSVVWSARLGSFSSFCSAACTSASIGTLVNSNSTSKDTMISLSKIVSLLTVDTMWAELVTVYSDFPIKGDKMLAK